jgi:hypothetical protein
MDGSKRADTWDVASSFADVAPANVAPADVTFVDVALADVVFADVTFVDVAPADVTCMEALLAPNSGLSEVQAMGWATN